MVVWKTTFVRGRDNLFWNGKQILSFFRTTLLTFETPLSYSKTQFLNKKKLSCFCEVFKRQIYYPKIRQRKTRSVFSVFFCHRTKCDRPCISLCYRYDDTNQFSVFDFCLPDQVMFFRSRLWNKTLYFASKIWKLASNITFMPKKWHLTIKKIRAINLESWEKMIEFKFIFMSKSCSSIYPWWSFKTYWPDLVAFCLSQSSSIFVVRKFRSFRTKKVIFIWQVSKHSTKFVFLLF